MGSNSDEGSRFNAQVAGDYHGGMSERKAKGRRRDGRPPAPPALDMPHLGPDRPSIQGKRMIGLPDEGFRRPVVTLAAAG